MIRRNALRVLVLALSIASLCYGTPGLAAEIPKKIDEKLAHKLAVEAYGEGMDPTLFDYSGPAADPVFFIFQGLNEPPVEGSFGFFAVNPWTGDVWALWGCYKLASENSRFTQTEIFKQFTPKEWKQYARLSRLKPDCIVEDPLAEAGH